MRRSGFIVTVVLTVMACVSMLWSQRTAGPQRAKGVGTKAIEQGDLVRIDAIQVSALPEAQGGGQLLHLHTGAGIFGPIRASEAPLEALAVHAVQPNPPAASDPCTVGQYVSSESHLYLCTAIPAPTSPDGPVARWRRLAWDTSFDSASSAAAVAARNPVRRK